MARESLMPAATRQEPGREQLEVTARQARGFARVRAAHQSELAEDYVEMIDDLIAARGEARAADLSARFGVTPATVARAVQRLVRDGLVTSEPYRSLFLTEKGRALAARARERHHLVRDFLIALGVGREAAEQDAEGIEHHISAETLEAFRRFLKRGSARLGDE